MKILMISDFYPPFLGGSYRHVQLLSRGLVKRDHDVVVCTIGNKYLNCFEEDYGVKVIRFEGFFQKLLFLFKDIKIKQPPPLQDFLISKKIKSVIKEEKPDIIHSHGWILYSVLPLMRKIDIPLLVTLHDCGFLCPKITLLNNNLLCNDLLTVKCINCAKSIYGIVKSLFIYYGIKSNINMLKFVDKFIAVSTFVKNIYFTQLKLSKKDITVIPNFYEEKKGNVKIIENNLFPDDFILFIGDLAPHKGVDILIKAYDTLNTDTKLILIGKKYQGHIYKNTKKIIIIRNAPHEIVMRAYKQSKFVVIPSRCPDSCPTVALEAMSCKKAIIASNIGGLSDIIVNNETGILIPPNNYKKLSKALYNLLKHPSKANKMGKKGYKRFIQYYSSDVIIPKIERLYRSLQTLI